MKKQYYVVFLFFFLTFVNQLFAQKSNKELPSVNIISIGFTGGFDLPGADLNRQFGWSNTIGGSFMYKTNKNWLFSLNGDFIFGQNVEIVDQLFKEIGTSGGHIIDEGGIYTDISILERGMTADISVGKLFPVLSPNKNSGIVITLGLGYMYHKIRLEQNENAAPQISGDYAKGYDRLAGGLMFTEFIGYHFYGNNNTVNFYAGFEFHQGLTQALRPWNFDEMKPPKSNRLDLLNGFKVGWIIPLGKQTNRKSYSF